MIWRSEVGLHREALFCYCVVVEFGAVVERERLELMAVAADGARRCARHFILVPGGQLLDDCVPGLALHQREHTVAHITAHHGVALPMPELLARFDFSRSFANGPLAGEHAA